MTSGDWLKKATVKLANAGVGTARLDALVLLEDATKKDRTYLLAHPETIIQESSLERLNSRIEKRVKHEPLAYIRGKSEFYNREFFINHGVLQPRSESETMIDLLLKLSSEIDGGIKSRLLDIGTGSGALAITAKLELPGLEVLAIDIDEGCLKVARKNALKHKASVKFYRGNLLDPLTSNIYHLPSIILANLPYVPDSHTINEAAMHEPKIAIFGGSDGLDHYRRMFEQLKSYNWQPKYILTESLPSQHDKLMSIAGKAGYRLIETRDLIQTFYFGLAGNSDSV